ncbi:MAG: UvrD-helicase domain-containing protein [Halobacterium sp.]
MSTPSLTDESAAVTRLQGAPGSGKTYTLTQEHAVEERDERDVSLADVRYLTFTKSGRYDAMEAMAEVYPNAEEDDIKKSVRTLHSAALSAVTRAGLLDLGQDGDDDIIREGGSGDGTSVFEWFFSSEHPGIEYREGAFDPSEVLDEDTDTTIPTGNRILQAYNYCRSKVWDLKYYEHAPYDIDLPPHRVMDVFESWEAFKDEHNLYQDDDYVYLALHNALTPDAKVLYIDEFQDLSPLQYELYKVWRDSSVVERVYIAGDDKQAIYGFRGADPKYFRETPVSEEERREMSRRCPAEVVNAARCLFDDVSGHDVSNVTAKEDGGTVEHRDADGPDALAALVDECLEKHGETFLLARTNRQAYKMAWALREAGYPYTGVKEDGALGRWQHPMPALLSALRRIRDGSPLPKIELQTLLEESGVAQAEAVVPALPKAGDDGPATYGDDALAEVYGGVPTAEQAVRALDVDEWRHELLANALDSDATHDPDDVQIGTIHSVKGLEADAVILSPAYSSKMLDSYVSGDGVLEEHRLYYVGMTRARDAVYVIHDFHDGEEFPPLEG